MANRVSKPTGKAPPKAARPTAATDNCRTTSIYSSLGSLLDSGKFSDMTIRCGDREFKAHRVVVCTQSSFFDKALTGGFAEAASGVVELPEDDPDILERFLRFLYTGTYHGTDESCPVPMKLRDFLKVPRETREEEAKVALRVYIMADKFDVPSLTELAARRFFIAALLSWKKSDSFPAVVDELYTCTLARDTIRDVICDIVGRNIESKKHRERFDWVMRKHVDFAVGVMDVMIESSEKNHSSGSADSSDSSDSSDLSNMEF